MAQHILHDEHSGLKGFNVTKELEVELAAFVLDDTLAAIGTVSLPDVAEPLTRGPSDDHVDMISSQEGGEFRGLVGGQVLFETIGNSREILTKHGHGLRIQVDGSQHSKTGALHSQAEATAPTKKINTR
jgi:hypothetical protein